MTTQSSILEWRIPWKEEAGGLWPMGHKEWDTPEWLTANMGGGDLPEGLMRELSGVMKYCLLWIECCSHESIHFQTYKILHLRSMPLQFRSVAQSCLNLCNPMDCSTPGLPVHHQHLSLLKFMFIRSMMPSNHLILCCPLLLPTSTFPSIRVFSNESSDFVIRWPKYWSFSFNINPSNEHSGLISFRMGWLYLLAVQGILKSLLQHHSSKTSILQCSAFFVVQLTCPYMTTGKNHSFD